MSRNKKIAIGCGIVSLLLACVCVLVGVLGGGFLFYLGGEPENLVVEAEYPWTVQAGDSFELILNIQNTGGTDITIGDIDLDEFFGGSILDGAVVERTDPPMERDYSISGIKSFHYDRVVSPGESQEVTFYLQAVKVGEFGGSIAVHVGDRARRINVAITVTPK